MMTPGPVHDPFYKSAPGDGHDPIPVGTNVLTDQAVFSPVMILKESALSHNLGELSRYCREEGVRIAPHGKTTMSPELTLMQVQAGAWAISAATPAQVRAFWEFGLPRVLLANELVDPAGIRWIAEHLAAHRDHEFLCYVDSVRGVQILDEVLTGVQGGPVLDVLVEVSAPGGRTGLRTPEQALEVATAASRSPHLNLVGVAGYEGALVSDRSPQSIQRVADYCRQVLQTASFLDEHEVFHEPDVILSVGGGAFFDVVVDTLKQRPLSRSKAVILIRAGSYISHDDGLYANIAAFAQPGSHHTLRPALEIWGRILSRPEPGLAFADFGRRDVPFDQGLPIPRHLRSADGRGQRAADGMTVTALNDQHAYLSVPPGDRLAPGDWIGCGISHPCTAFDKWRHIPVVDDTYVVTGSVTTYF
jgi:D-serine deaminase-like pyridoxal phosphate-dependent protein